MYRFPAIALLFALPVLAGCATLSREECSSGDWHKIGVQDGSDGAPAGKFDQHAKACKLDRSEVSRATYLGGRRQGLAVYCTTVRGYREGALGQKYDGTCPADVAPAFLKGYQLGQRIFQAETRASDIADAYRAANERMHHSSLSESERAAAQQETQRLAKEDAAVRAEIKALRDQADTMVAAARKKSN